MRIKALGLSSKLLNIPPLPTRGRKSQAFVYFIFKNKILLFLKSLFLQLRQLWANESSYFRCLTNQPADPFSPGDEAHGFINSALKV